MSQPSPEPTVARKPRTQRNECERRERQSARDGKVLREARMAAYPTPAAHTSAPTNSLCAPARLLLNLLCLVIHPLSLCDGPAGPLHLGQFGKRGGPYF